MIALYKNLNHQDPFVYIDKLSFAGIQISFNYTDVGWLNSGKKLCDHQEKVTIDNSYFHGSGSDIIFVCHKCRKFWHVDISDLF